MTIERGVMVLAGVMVMLTTALSLLHHQYWSYVTLFVGFNVFQSVFTGFCPAAMIMKKFGMKSGSGNPRLSN